MNRQGQEPSTKNGRLRPMILKASQLTALVLTLSFAAVGFQPAPSGVYIQIDDTVVYQETTANTVDAVLTTHDIAVEAGSIIEPGEQALVQDGMYITISTPKTITLQVGEKIEEIETTALTVEELILEQNIDTTKSILQALSPQDYIKENTTITFNESATREETVSETQPYVVEYTTDADLFEDEERTVQAGIDREVAQTYEITTVNGIETTRNLISESILTEGQPEIIATGTKVRPVETPTPTSVQNEVEEQPAAPTPVTESVATPTLSMEMSGYSIEGSCGTGACFTASGYNIGTSPLYQHPTYGAIHIVAADTSVLPMGSIIEIAGFGKAIVLDTGGYIIGNRIDFLFATDAEALSWGRGNVSISIIE